MLCELQDCCDAIKFHASVICIADKRNVGCENGADYAKVMGQFIERSWESFFFLNLAS